MSKFENYNDFGVEDLKEALNYYFGNIMVTNHKGELVFVNESGASYYGYNSKSMLGVSAYELVEKGLQDKSVCAEAIEKKQRSFSIIKTAKGVELACVANPILDENGDVQMVVVYSQDESLIRDIMKEVKSEKQKSINMKQAIDYLQDFHGNKDDIIVADDKMAALYTALGNIAKTDSTIMIYGESGTGKEVLARFIHKNSRRCKEIFIPINCAAIPAELMESEFFGYERGAFTGAIREGRAGIFETADKGTLFLDELGELPLALQTKLLRVLESGEVKRIGSSKTIYTDVRIIAATNRNLRKMVSEKLFREDLYYRLNVIPVEIPPLRERPKDIAAFAEHFLKEYNKKYDCDAEIDESLNSRFENYSWPGNVRELRNEIERYVISCKAGRNFSIMDYQTASPQAPNSINKNIQYSMKLKEAMGNYEKDYIKEVIKQCGGNISKASRQLGIHRTALYKKMGKYKSL